MTADHPIRRALSRVCSDETMSRVVDPTLADMRVETHRPAWRGYLALARALLVHGVTSLPGAFARAYMDDERAVPRLAAMCLASALLAAIPFVLIPLLGPLRTAIAADTFIGVAPRSARTLTMFLLLLPQALVVTLPPALLVALPLALRTRPASARRLRRILALALAACVAMGVLVEWGAPLGNQGFRVIVSGNPRLTRGEAETGLRGLRDRIESQRRNRWADSGMNERVVRWLEYRYQMRLALIVSPVPLALLAMGLAATRAGRHHPVPIGAIAGIAYTIAVVPLDNAALRLAESLPAVSAGLFAWLPMMTITALALAAWRATASRAIAGLNAHAQ